MRHNYKKLVGVMMALCAVISPVYAVKVAGDTLTAGEVFVRLPLKTLDILRKTTRMDMLDYYAADSIYKAPNGMEGLSELVLVRPDYLDVKITPVTKMQILTFDTGKNPAAMTLYTIGGEGQAYDTDVAFFDASMQELPRKKYLQYPDILDFFDVPDKQVKDRIEDIIPFPTIEFIPSPDSKDLQAKLTVGEFLGREDYDYIKKYMKSDPLIYRWNGKKYDLLKRSK